MVGIAIEKMGFTDIGVPRNTKPFFSEGAAVVKVWEPLIWRTGSVGEKQINKKEITVRESSRIGSRERLVLYDVYARAIVVRDDTIRNV